MPYPHHTNPHADCSPDWMENLLFGMLFALFILALLTCMVPRNRRR